MATRISFSLIKDKSLDALQKHFNNRTKDLYKSKSDSAGNNRDVGSDLRSKGTVQSSTWQMKRRKPDEKWFIVVTRQDKVWAEGLSAEKEKYALVITLTDRENADAKLYTHISQKIQQQSQIRVHT